MSAARAAAALTGPVEDYLKVIFELEAAGGTAGTNEIANALGIAAPSVSGMVRRLAEQGLIEYERYRGARLTAQGRVAALRTIRRHRVIEAYLTTALGYPWDRVHEEAERLEHAASEELIDRMAAAIGEPETDPHGAPIPTREGTMPESEDLSLDEVAAGTRVNIQRVHGRDPAKLRYLAELGIRPGIVADVISREPFDGPLTLKIGDKEQSIGPSLAQQILVTTDED